MELRIGDYVRTKEGNIYKIAKLGYNNETFWSDTDDGWFAMYKSSPNIIDLIEVGDYINGLRVEENKYGELYTSYVYYGGDIGKQCEVYTSWIEEKKENEEYIESILTKEQFESMEYKVKE